MPNIDFPKLKELSPQAFKLYAYFLHLSDIKNTNVFTLTLADLGEESGLQADQLYPALRHGRDGQLRRALSELIQKGLVDKQGGRGRAPNTYTLLDT